MLLGHGPPLSFLEVASKRSCPLLGPLLAVGLSLVGLMPLPCEALRGTWWCPGLLSWGQGCSLRLGVMFPMS